MQNKNKSLREGLRTIIDKARLNLELRAQSGSISTYKATLVKKY